MNIGLDIDLRQVSEPYREATIEICGSLCQTAHCMQVADRDRQLTVGTRSDLPFKLSV